MAGVAGAELPKDVGLAVRRPHLAQQGVGHLEDRDGLAGADVDRVVVRLGTLECLDVGAGDVGLLLQDTAAAQAEALIARVLRLLEREGVPAGQLSIGMATRRPGDPVTGALAEEARQRTRYHASDH